MPPGWSSSAAFRQPTAGSTQWKAVAENTAANDPSGQLDLLEASDVEAGPAGPADAAARDLDHPRPGIDGFDLEPACDQQLGELAGATSHLDDVGTGAEPAALQRCLDERRRIPAAGVVVCLGHIVEDFSSAAVWRCGRHGGSVRRGGRHLGLRDDFPSRHRRYRADRRVGRARRSSGRRRAGGRAGIPIPRRSRLAAERGAVEPAGSLGVAVADAELALVAAPVAVLAGVVRETLAAAPADCTVTDVGSTKSRGLGGGRRGGALHRRPPDLRLRSARAGAGDR